MRTAEPRGGIDQNRTVHVISVGLSLLDNLQKDGHRSRALQRNWPPWEASAYDPDLAPVDRAAHEIQRALSPEETGSSWLLRFVQDLDPASWPSELSAELQTFAHLPNGAGRRLGNLDLAVLLLSDTMDGLLAGLGNGLALARAEAHRVHYLDNPEGQLPTDQGVLLVRVPDLDARDEPQMKRAMRQLGVLARSLHQAFEQAVPYQFHLSGGFRATIPYLIGIAEGMRSLSCREVEAFVMHEEAKSPPISLPLRRIPSAWVRDELEEVVNNKDPRRYLEGYAYEPKKGKQGSPYELTPFGVGLQSLFGLSHKPFGE